ncbi:efflux RND transporter permease subunit [Clostridiaceae bacterium M8S5]|nr:efflux RND transporter permease subunit [Clostridiaceae bacterium M8S5]
MKRLMLAAIKRRKITLFLIVFFSIIGMYNYYILPKQESPDINVPIAIITTIYPGASPDNIEKLVTSKIEDTIKEIDGYKSSQSYSKNSISIVRLDINNDVDVNMTWDKLRTKMSELQSKLPSGCKNINVNTKLAETAGIIISMSGKDYTYEELASYAEMIKSKLSKIDGISRFDITGKQEKEVQINVDFRKLNQYNLSFEDIATIVKAQNVDIPSGSIDSATGQINVKVSKAFSSLEEIGNTIINVSSETGAVLKLKDIADIGYEHGNSNLKIKHQGLNSVLLTGYFSSGKNIIIVGKEVEKVLNDVEKNLPSDIIYNQVHYQPNDVSHAVNDFSNNLLIGILLVIVVVFIGMGFRNAIIVSTAIPLSILITITGFKIIGGTIHEISISASIVALGMLVDNAIVVSDSIQVRIDNKENKIDACVRGTLDVAIPVLTSTLTTIGAFLPLLLLNSLAGEYIISLPQIIILSLTASYIVALFVTPTMAYIFFKESSQKNKKYRIRSFFTGLLKQSLKHKFSSIFICLICICIGGFLVSKLGLQFFPKADRDVFYIDIKAEQPGNIDITEKLADKVSDILSNQTEVVDYTVSIGDGLPKFYDTMPIFYQSNDFAQVMVKVDLSKTDRFKTYIEFTDYLQGMFDRTLSGGTATANLLEIGVPIGHPVKIRLVGDDIQTLYDYAGKVKKLLKDIPDTINIGDNLEEKEYEYYVDIDTNKASTLGISKYEIQKEIYMAMRGNNISVFRNEGNEYNITLKGNIKTKNELENLAIKSKLTGNKHILKQMAKVKLIPKTNMITKFNNEICVTVYSDVKEGGSAVDIENAIQPLLSTKDFEHAQIIFDGERESINDNFGSLGTSAIFAVLVIYLILLMQFNSYVQPLVILITIPFSSIGSIIGLYVLGQTLSFTALLGMVSLMGIVVNNAIVLIDYINKEIADGKNIEDACSHAVDRRFRPIILSTSTTIIGLIPLAISRSEIFTPLSISLIFGLIISTLLTMIMIPTIYSMIMNKVHKVSDRIVRR